MLLSAEQVAYQARALAQTDPWTRAARRHIDRAVATHAGEKQEFPKEFLQWAVAAALKGYSVRVVEEDDAGYKLSAAEDGPDDSELATKVGQVIEVIRAGEDGEVTLEAVLLGDEDRTLEALDRVVTSELSTRYNNMSATPNLAQRSEFEEWMAHWVVQGYALRVAELMTGAVVTP